MLIISKYKDYYDHIPYNYGVDKTIIFNRSKLKWSESVECLIDKNRYSFPDIYQHNRYVNSVRGIGPEYNYEIKWISICGRLHLIVRDIRIPKSGFALITKQIYDEMGWKNRKYGWKNNRDPSFEECIGKSEPKEFIIRLHKLFDNPIFEIYEDCDRNFQFDSVENLGELGFGKLYPPNIIYQNILHFICNVMVDNPDTLPPVEISDKDKIVGHGFDIKQSFRNRK
jgi:hypothetical protein